MHPCCPLSSTLLETIFGRNGEGTLSPVKKNPHFYFSGQSSCITSAHVQT